MDTLPNVMPSGAHPFTPTDLIYHIDWNHSGQSVIHKDVRSWGDLVQAQSGKLTGEYPTTIPIPHGMKLANKLDPQQTGSTVSLAVAPSTVGRALPASGSLGFTTSRDYRLEATFNDLSGDQLNGNSWVVGVHVRTGNVTDDSNVPVPLVRLATTLRVDTLATATTMRLNIPKTDITYDPQYNTPALREINSAIPPILRSVGDSRFTVGLEFSFSQQRAKATLKYDKGSFEVTAKINVSTMTNASPLYDVLQNQQLTTAAVILILEKYSEQASVICESFKMYEG